MYSFGKSECIECGIHGVKIIDCGFGVKIIYSAASIIECGIHGQGLKHHWDGQGLKHHWV